MSLNLRKQQIIDILNKKQRVSVKALSKELYVCEMTIRRDLKELESAGFLIRYHGGAVLPDSESDMPISVRMHINEKEKKKIARIAQKHLKDNQIIFLEASSTCAYLIPYLKEHKNMTVITNCVMFLPLLNKYGVRCKLTGGDYMPSENCLAGRDAENYLRGVNVDVAFISCNGLSFDGTLTEDVPELAEIAKIMKKNSRRCIVLMDKTKVNYIGKYNLFHKNEVDELITVKEEI